MAIGVNTIVAFSGDARRIALGDVCRPPPGTERGPAPHLVRTVSTCPHRRQGTDGGAWRCLDCPAVLGAMGVICSPWQAGALTGRP